MKRGPAIGVRLTGQGPAGQTQTIYLISTSNFERQTARFGRQVCNTAGQNALGSFTWSGDTGSLTFTVPEVEAGDYYFQVKVRGVSPDCWRIGGGSGALVLTVLPGSATEEIPALSPANPLVALVLVAFTTIATALIARLTRRRA